MTRGNRLRLVRAFALAVPLAWLAAPGHTQERRTGFFLKIDELKPGDQDTPLQKARKEAFNAALRTAVMASFEWAEEKTSSERFLQIMRETMTAYVAAVDDPAARVEAWELHVVQVQGVLLITEERRKAGKASESELRRVRFYRADAEVKLLEAQDAAKGGVKVVPKKKDGKGSGTTP